MLLSEKAYKSVPVDVAQAFQAQGVPLPAKAPLLSDCTIGGITYSTATKHRGNSNILVPDRDSKMVPLVIQYIVQHPANSEIYLLARRHHRASVTEDPYERYKVLHAKMWSPLLEKDLELVIPAQVVSHFATLSDISWGGEKVTAVLSLARVYICFFFVSASVLICSSRHYLSSQSIRRIA